jgi:hypothetical protein
MIDFSQVRRVIIPEGEAVSISCGEDVLWNYGVPPEYQVVKYLESTGWQYIDTGITVNSSNHRALRLVVDKNIISTSGWCLDGAANNGQDAFYHGRSSAGLIAYGIGGDIQTAVSYGSGRYTFDLDAHGNRFLVTAEDGTVLIDLAPSFGTNFTYAGLPLYLFGYSGERRWYAGRIYSCQIYDSGELVRDFVPCYRNADSKPGMYDRKNEKFYTNCGADEFLYR